MSIVVDQLVIEVTRECNAACEHCLRGRQEKVKIKKSYIRQLLSQVKHVRSITFTGGEPTLNIQAIRDTLNIAKELEVEVGHIYIVTNAVTYSKGLVRVMNDWLQYCLDCEGVYNVDRDDISNFIKQYRSDMRNYEESWVPKWYEDYTSDHYFGLAASVDQFHPKYNNKAYELYKTLPYYSLDKEFTFKQSSLINEGNAKKNGIGSREMKRSDFYLEFYDEECLVELLYLNAFGFILPECDLSYNSQRKWKPCSIKECSLQEIIKLEEKSCAA